MWSSNLLSTAGTTPRLVGIVDAVFPLPSKGPFSGSMLVFWGVYHTPYHPCMVRYIYLHLVDFYGKRTEIYHTWIVWVLNMGILQPAIFVYRNVHQF